VSKKYFTSVFTQESEYEVLEFRETARFLSKLTWGVTKVLEVLAGLKVDKSPGPDELCPRLLWEAREETAGALTQIPL